MKHFHFEDRQSAHHHSDQPKFKQRHHHSFHGRARHMEQYSHGHHEHHSFHHGINHCDRENRHFHRGHHHDQRMEYGMMRRGRHPGGLGFCHGQDGDEFDMHNFGSKRRIRSEELQLIVLLMIEKQPKHGYEIIKELKAHTFGFYAPSPGMIYPVLTYLEESDLATATLESNKKCYHISEAGKIYLAENRHQAEDLYARLRAVGQKIEQMQQVFSEEQSKMPEGESLHLAIHQLRTLLHAKRDSSEEEKHHILDIINTAIKEIKAL
ncbi:PadR family transcriptional regulator [Zophobihabitans entericus]|uniref:PadR family transcriptional regulator n=1 Tax=Zophobihabitans entericus TaxID=1635327 RepID=A0A6G9IE47_9GAMM|nr:PadR family transcriptional regulator [Zophobihabitans entericus]QIQ21964.1 PadR family transcriptional regulator [Zophobihabitans entericus]